jgi:hypothetical protein
MIDELERCQNLSGNGYISGVPNGKKSGKKSRMAIFAHPLSD